MKPPPVRINGYPVERVESFDELAAGMRVFDVRCKKCSGTHEAVLVERRVGDLVGADGVREYSWKVDPAPHGHPEGGFAGIGRSAIAAGRIYVATDGRDVGARR